MVSGSWNPARLRWRLGVVVAALVAAAWLALALVLVLGGGRTAAPPTDWLLLALGALVPGGLSASAAIGAARDGPRDSPRAETLAVVSGLLALGIMLPLGLLLVDPILTGPASDDPRPEPAAVPGRAGVVLPSPEIAYAALLAVAATALGAGELRGRSASGAAALAGATVAVAGLLGAAPVMGGMRSAPGCATPPSTMPEAAVTMTAEALIDGRPIGSGSLTGERDGRDLRWSGRTASALVGSFTAEGASIAGRRWLRVDGDEWQVADSVSDGYELDLGLQRFIASRSLIAAEDGGVELSAGQLARHCRLVIDGTTALALLSPARWLVDGRPPADGMSLDVWRGELEWWLGPDGWLLAARVLVGGHPADAWAVRALRGELRGTLSVREADAPVTIEEPVP